MSSRNYLSCAVCGYNTDKQYKPRKTRSFYRFPKVKSVASQWISACNFNNMDSTDDSFRKLVVCSDHFESKWFRNKSVLSKGLVKGAVPTKNLNELLDRERFSEMPMELEVKVKVEQQVCHGCLSADRRTSPLGDLADILAALVDTPKDVVLHFCWECMANLDRIKRFQSQVKYAQNLLIQTQYQLSSYHHSLSTLVNSQKDYYDQEMQHDDAEVIDYKDSLKEEKLTKDDNNYTDFIETEKELNANELADDLNYEDEIISESKDDLAYDIGLNSGSSIPTICDKKKRKVQRSIKMEYKMYAKIVVLPKWTKPYKQYYTEVSLDEEEIEEYFLKKARQKTGVKMHLKCKLCALTYGKKIDLDRHNDLNHHKPNTPYKCLHCKESLPCPDSLKAHWRSHSVFYKCDMCDSHVWACSIALHLKRSHAAVYACTSCKLQFRSLVSFTEHYNKNHPFVCDYCEKKCALRPVLEKHIQEHHIPQHCIKCDLTLLSRRKYVKHCRELHPEVLQLDERPELSYCVECDRQFPSRFLYAKHLNSKHAKPSKTSLKRIPCPECGKAFKKNCDMLLHYNYSHVKVTKFHCELCDKYFLKMFGLRTHMENVHLKIPKPKNKVCDLCGRAFQTNVTLNNHRRTHTGERPFKCAYCPAAFAQKGAMKVHQRKQHSAR